MVPALLFLLWVAACGVVRCQQDVLPPSVDVSSSGLQTLKDLTRTLLVKSDAVSVTGEQEEEGGGDADVGVGTVEIVALGDVLEDRSDAGGLATDVGTAEEVELSEGEEEEEGKSAEQTTPPPTATEITTALPVTTSSSSFSSATMSSSSTGAEATESTTGATKIGTEGSNEDQEEENQEEDQEEEEEDQEEEEEEEEEEKDSVASTESATSPGSEEESSSGGTKATATTAAAGAAETSTTSPSATTTGTTKAATATTAEGQEEAHPPQEEKEDEEEEEEEEEEEDKPPLPFDLPKLPPRPRAFDKVVESVEDLAKRVRSGKQVDMEEEEQEEKEEKDAMVVNERALEESDHTAGSKKEEAPSEPTAPASLKPRIVSRSPMVQRFSVGEPFVLVCEVEASPSSSEVISFSWTKNGRFLHYGDPLSKVKNPIEVWEIPCVKKPISSKIASAAT